MMKKFYGSNANANKASGLYRGIVEDNQDPYNLGRIKVRVPNFNGVPNQSDSYMKTDDLPWAFPCFQSAGPDHGTIIVPEVGDTVWVLFENSERDSPVYIGASYGLGSNNVKELKSEGSSTFKSTNRSWSDNTDEDTSEAPKEYLENNKNIKVIYKSPKGSIIYINEEDGNESINLIDRFGQIIKMSCPMTSGSLRRSTGSILNEDELPRDQFTGSGEIIIKTRGDPDDSHDDAYLNLKESHAMLNNGLNYLEILNDGIHIKSDLWLDDTEYVNDYDPDNDTGEGVNEVEIVKSSTKISLPTSISTNDITSILDELFI